MSLSFNGRRLCRVATLGLLVGSAWLGQTRFATAQATNVANPFRKVSATIETNSPAPTPVEGNAVSEGAAYDGPVPGEHNWGNYDTYADCGPSCDCGPTCNCGPVCQPGSDHYSGWFGAEYIRWRLDGNRLPPLVTAGPATTPLADVAQLDDPGTVILSGDETVNDDWRDGYRFFGGFWFDCCHTCGIGFDYFDMGNDDYNFLSPQSPNFVTGRPFFNTQTGDDDVELVSVPNQLDGTAQVRSNDGFQGAGITLNRTLWRCCDPCGCGDASGLSLLSGYRNYDYDSNLSITERLTVLPGTTTPLVPGTTFLVQDQFRTHNEFNGGELGFQGYKKHCWYWFDGMAKLAMGSQRRTVRINGTTITDVPGGGTSTAAGGLLTSELTNIGRYSDSDFVVIPEFRLGVGACVTKCISVRAGYNCILWGDVARASSQLPPGLQVDPRNLPPTQAGGGADPAFTGIHGSQLIAHGFDASVMWQW